MRKNRLYALGLAAILVLGAVGCSTPTASVEETEAAGSEAAGTKGEEAAASGEK